MTTSHQDDAARARYAIQSVLDGNPPNGTKPEDCGPWKDPVAAIFHAWDVGGTEKAIAILPTLIKAAPGLDKLLSSGAAPTKLRAPQPKPAEDAPELPKSAQMPKDLAAEASPWLNAYIAHSHYWSPRSFGEFHEAIGIWILSTVAARRIVAHVGKPQYTPLQIALAGRSSIHAKTTAAEIGVELLRGAGLDWLLADDNVTPQKFIKDRTQYIPDGYDGMQPEDKERARLHLAFSGQCGWWYDEFGMLLHAMARSGSAMSDFSGLLRKFDDCLPSYTHGTIGRPTDKVILPYLALLGSLTPADLRPVMRRGDAGWTNGFWARWAFVTPPDDGYKNDRFPAGERRPPQELLWVLREWHNRLGVPSVAIQDKDTFSVGPLPVNVVTVEDEVVNAYYTYGDAVMELVAKSGLDELDSWHSRLSIKALRIALLLASLENNDVADLRHWARAQEITENWRASVHRLYRQTNSQIEASAESQAEDIVYEIILRLGSPSVRDMKTRIATMSAGEIKDRADRLVKAGLVDAIPTGRTIRYQPAKNEGTEEASSSVVYGITERSIGELKK
jgi:hypothetical protein